MSVKDCSNAKLIELAYEKTPPTFDGRLSEGTKKFFIERNVIISTDEFVPLQNEIFKTLINRIGLTSFVNLSTSNPLSTFKSGSMAFGDTIQEISNDIIEGRHFEGSNVQKDQFKPYNNDVNSAYYRINRQDYYPVTVYGPDLNRAFLNANGLQQLISGILGTLDKSNTVDEFILTKRLFKEHFTGKIKPIQKTQVVEVPNIVSGNATTADIKTFIETVKKVAKAMTFNSRDFNQMQYMSAVNPSDMVMVCDYRASIVNEVQNLSGLFNPQYNAINMPIIDVDNFSTNKDGSPDADMGKVIAIMCDKNTFDIKKTFSQVTNSANAESLYTNYFFHIHQLYRASPFRSCVYFVAN